MTGTQEPSAQRNAVYGIVVQIFPCINLGVLLFFVAHFFSLPLVGGVGCGLVRLTAL